jgi:hypothetical protein
LLLTTAASSAANGAPGALYCDGWFCSGCSPACASAWRRRLGQLDLGAVARRVDDLGDRQVLAVEDDRLVGLRRRDRVVRHRGIGHESESESAGQERHEAHRHPTTSHHRAFHSMGGTASALSRAARYNPVWEPPNKFVQARTRQGGGGRSGPQSVARSGRMEPRRPRERAAAAARAGGSSAQRP